MMQFSFPLYPSAQAIGPAKAIIAAKKAPLTPKTATSAFEYTESGFTPSLLAKRKHPVSRPRTRITCRTAIYAMNSVTTP